MVESVRDEGEMLEGGRASADPVLTETAADLYARQGLHDRAAEVYAHLLVERPADEELQAKLRRAREAAGRRTGQEAGSEPARREQEASGTVPGAQGGGDPAESDARSSPADEVEQPSARTESGESTDDGELEEVEAAWTGGDGALAAERTPYAWEEEPGSGVAQGEEGREPVAGRSVREYFRKLLSWRSPAEGSVPAQSEAAGRDSSGPGAVWPATSPDVGLEIVERVTKRPSRAESPGAGELGGLFVAPSEAATVSDGGGVEAESARREGKAEARRESPWDRAASSRRRGFGAVERLASDPPSGAEPSAEVLGPVRAKEDDDDELGMFRAWLQSLKR